MKNKPIKEYAAQELDQMAADTSDVKPMSAHMRRKWDAAKKTGKRMAHAGSKKAASATTQIVPVSIEPTLLSEVDRYAKSAGISRSRLVSEGLRLRMKQS